MADMSGEAKREAGSDPVDAARPAPRRWSLVALYRTYFQEVCHLAPERVLFAKERLAVVRMTLMGHTNRQPAYGDGGSMAFRRDELLKIAHPFPPGCCLDGFSEVR